MKKRYVILLNLCILLLLAFCLAHMIISAQKIADYVSRVEWSKAEIDELLKKPVPDEVEIFMWQSGIDGLNELIREESLWLPFSIAGIVASVFLAVYLNPFIFRKSTYSHIAGEWEKNKAERERTWQENEAAAKQKRIDELKAELDELQNKE